VLVEALSSESIHTAIGSGERFNHLVSAGVPQKSFKSLNTLFTVMIQLFIVVHHLSCSNRITAAFGELKLCFKQFRIFIKAWMCKGSVRKQG